jgi:hypothetical protein
MLRDLYLAAVFRSTLYTGVFATMIRATTAAMAEGGLIGVLKLYIGYLRAVAAWTQAAAIATWEWTIALLANPVTWIVLAVAAVILLTAGLVYLVTQVKSVNHWLRENWWWLGLIVVGLNPYIAAVVTISLYWKEIVQAIKAAYEWMKKLVTLKWVPGFGGGKAGFAGRALNALSYTPLNPLLGPRLIGRAFGFKQGGGFASGWNMVGEAGPELVRLPYGSRVFNERQVGSAAGMGGLVITVIPQPINLDGYKIAEVVARVVTHKEARS